MPENNGFTTNAELYATSAAHSETEDLEGALEHLGAIDGHECLDVATGSGHTALFLAKHSAHVFAVDINERMLSVAQEESDKKSLPCRFLKGAAEELPFDDESFDLVTCRLAAHHFSDPVLFLSEAHRVLRSAGHLLVVDNIVPDHKQTADWVNTFERQRDPEHVECWTQEHWESVVQEHGFTKVSSDVQSKSLDFDLWTQRMSASPELTEQLWTDLASAQPSVQEFLEPATDSGRTITLHRLVLVAQKS